MGEPNIPDMSVGREIMLHEYFKVNLSLVKR